MNKEGQTGTVGPVCCTGVQGRFVEGAPGVKGSVGEVHVAYLAGKMRGIKYFNFPAFDAERDRLTALGLRVISPADLDRANGFDATKLPENYDWNTVPSGLLLQDCIDRDTAAIKECDVVVVLPGWETSVGVRAEKALAEWSQKPVLEAGTFKRLPPTPAASPTGEVIVTDPKTGGQKGAKPCRMDLLPWGALADVAKLYGYGANKYAAHNWRRGYKWSLSVAAMQRHFALWYEGEDDDAETKCNHLTSVVFHALTLLHYTKHHREGDDRPNTKQEAK